MPEPGEYGYEEPHEELLSACQVLVAEAIAAITAERDWLETRAERLSALEDGGRKDGVFSYESEWVEERAYGLTLALKILRGDDTCSSPSA